MDPGTAGAIAGAAIGVLGGVIGTWCSVAQTKGPRERRFVLKAATGFWIGIALFLGLLFAIPGPYRWLAFLPYGIALTLAIRFVNQRQLQAQQQETSSEPG